MILFFFNSFAGAQDRFDFYFGMGTTQVGSAHQLIANSAGEILSTPHMGGLFGTIGGGLMIKPSYGFGAQVSWRFAQGDYAGYGYRPVFYDFNGIFTPQKNRLVIPEFQAGLGGVSIRIYDPSNPYYDYNTGRISTFATSFNHFQLHAAAGLRFRLARHIYVRPQLDYHWVPNLTNEFKSNSVLGYSLAALFSSGD